MQLKMQTSEITATVKLATFKKVEDNCKSNQASNKLERKYNLCVNNLI